MIKTNICFCLIILLTVALLDQVKAVSEENEDVIRMGKDNLEYEKNVNSKDFKIFCKKPTKASLTRIWKTTYFEINSTSDCTLYEASNETYLDEMKKNQSKTYLHYSQKVFKFFLNLVKNADDTGNSVQVIYVPTFKPHCIGIQTNGRLQVKLKHQDFDLKLYIYFMSGIIIFFIADRISRSDYFQYSTGVSIGIIGSFIILVVVLTRFIPKKSTALLTFISGGSFGVFSLRWLYFNYKTLGGDLQYYLLLYVALSAAFSLAICYYYGPIKNERGLFIIDLVIKFFGLLLIYIGTSLKEISILCIILLLTFRWSRKLLNTKLISKISYKIFPPKRRLLTMEEYNKEAQDFTAKQLEELKVYCKSPDCNSWRVMSRLKRPDRFARFIDACEPHVVDDEIEAYEENSFESDFLNNKEDDNINYNSFSDSHYHHNDNDLFNNNKSFYK